METLLLATLVLPLLPFKPFGIIDHIARFWARSLFFLCKIQIVTHSRTSFPEGGPYMVMANHRSNLDPPLLIAFTPYYLRFLTKKELFFIPFFGWALYLMGQIPIDRKRREKAIRSLQRSRKLLKQPGIAILAFPEGTRSRTEDLLPFKKGGFVFAIENGLPILPVGIGGTGPLLPKGNFLVRPGKVTFVVGEPIPTTQYTLSTKETLMAEVREKLTFLKKEADEILSRN